MTYSLKFNHGDRVMVIDCRGNHEARGMIAGRHDTRNGPRYDVQPDNELSLTGRLVGVPEERIRKVGVTLVKTAVSK